MRRLACLAGIALCLGACSASTQTAGSDLALALDAASLAESVYAAQPSANPKTVQDVSRLLASAQAAVQAWQSSGGSAEQGAAAAAIAALVEYENAAGVTGP